MKVLCLGDVVGKPGRQAVIALLEDLKKELAVDFTVVNGENAAGGSGITPRLANQLYRAGADVLTLGDHVWDQKDLEVFLDEQPTIVRPANFPEGTPGRGWCIHTLPNGLKVGVVNLLGRVFMRYQVACPFLMLEKIAEEIRKETPIIIVDMHAETTSEKVAMGHFIDGRVSVVFGTHTHIQTADDRVLSQGTAYITDLGMTGPYDSVIGQNKHAIIKRFLTSRPVRFQVAQDRVMIHGILVDIDEATGRARSITRVQRHYEDVSEAEAEPTKD